MPPLHTAASGMTATLEQSARACMGNAVPGNNQASLADQDQKKKVP